MLKLKGPSPAMTVACLSLAVALSGVGYAAVTIPRNSVGGKHLKRDAVTAPKVKSNSLGGADINEATLDVIQGSGRSSTGLRPLLEGTSVFTDVVVVPGSGVIQATCNATGTAATFRYRDTSNSLTYNWVDTGGADPADLLTAPNGTSANSVTSSAFDLHTWYVRPGASNLFRSIVHLAMSNELDVCTFFWNIQRVDH